MKNVLRTIGIHTLFELVVYFFRVHTHLIVMLNLLGEGIKFWYILLEIMDCALNRANCEMF